MVVAHEVAFEHNLGRVVDLPAEHWRHVITLALHIITETVAALAKQVQAVGQRAVLVQRAGGVEGSAVHALVVELAAQGDLGFW